MIDLTPVTTPRTSRRLRVTLAGMALVATGLLVPGAAGADTPPAPAPVPEFAPAPDGGGGGGTGFDGPDEIAIPDDGDGCHPLLASCDIAVPEDGDDCHPLLASCELTTPGEDPDPGDGPEQGPDDGPEVEGTDEQPAPAPEVRAAEVAVPIQSTPTFTG